MDSYNEAIIRERNRKRTTSEKLAAIRMVGVNPRQYYRSATRAFYLLDFDLAFDDDFVLLIEWGTKEITRIPQTLFLQMLDEKKMWQFTPKLSEQ